VAYDLSSAMLDTVSGEAQRRGLDNVRTVQGVVEDMPFAPETFDIAVSRYSAHHWLSLQSGLAQVRRALKPGASAIFSDVVSPGVPVLDTWLQALELFRDPSHVRDRSASEWLDVLCHEGFVVDRVETLRLRLDFVTWIERMKTSDASATAIRALLKRAPSDVNKHFAIEEDGTFTVDTALIVARTRP
jgi:SAM-dependent methyltransferase